MEIIDEYEVQEDYSFYRGNEIQPVSMRFRIELAQHNGELITLSHAQDLLPTVKHWIGKGFSPDEELRLFLDGPGVQRVSVRSKVRVPYVYYEVQDSAITAIDALLEQTEIPPVEKVVDLGSSDGGKFRHILDRVKHGYALALDFFPNPKEKGITYARADLDFNLPLKDKSIDLCCAVDAIAQLAEPCLGAQNAIRTLKPGGYFLMVDRNMKSSYVEKNAEKFGITILKNMTIPITVEEHPYPTEKLVDIELANSPELRPTEVATLRNRLLRERKAESEQVILSYKIDYFCLLARKN